MQYDNKNKNSKTFLSNSDSGCITLCKCCGKTNIEFGNFSFCSCEHEIKCLKDFLETLQPNHGLSHHSKRKKYYFKFPSTKIQIGLSESEYFELLSLLENALSNFDNHLLKEL